MIALFVGLAAGPASAGPDVGARVPAGKSGESGPKPSKGGEAKKNKQSGDGAKPASPARTGKKASNRSPGASGPASRGGGQHPGGPKPSSASHHEEADSDDNSPAGWPHQDEPVDTPTTSAQPVPTTTTPSTTTAPIRNPDRDIRMLSSGTAGITTDLAPVSADPAPAADDGGDAHPPPDAVIGGALDPPLLGAGPPPSRWAPFVPALDEPAFPAVLLAALAVFLALFGRGDRRDPKLVEAVVDDRAQDVDFS